MIQHLIMYDVYHFKDYDASQYSIIRTNWWALVIFIFHPLCRYEGTSEKESKREASAVEYGH